MGEKDPLEFRPESEEERIEFYKEKNIIHSDSLMSYRGGVGVLGFLRSWEVARSCSYEAVASGTLRTYRKSGKCA